MALRATDRARWRSRDGPSVASSEETSVGVLSGAERGALAAHGASRDGPSALAFARRAERRFLRGDERWRSERGRTWRFGRAWRFARRTERVDVRATGRASLPPRRRALAF